MESVASPNIHQEMQRRGNCREMPDKRNSLVFGPLPKIYNIQIQVQVLNIYFHKIEIVSAVLFEIQTIDSNKYCPETQR
jgi:hypothetical protein